MQTSQSREIDGLEFTVTMLPPKQARGALLRLTRLAGPALSSLAEDNAKSVLDLDTAKVLSAVSVFFAGMAEDDLEYFITAFGAKSTVLVPELDKHVPVSDASVFAGRGVLIVFKWLVFAIEVNYADFLDAAKTQFSRPNTEKKA